eukprot:TRINITY_DN4756_c0_g1_i2.p1 TRINITY_DN4756_c0_g1~~TRINITY_DN4756_c0_g1_i2.p1  ORF type:complete len:622 (-),score=69.66 TRINITY_DN4756_c0_g1_i2:534-2399(-)
MSQFFAALRSHTNFLELGANNMKSSGLVALAEVITPETKIRYLSLYENYISDKSTGIENLSNSLKNNLHLREFNIAENKVRSHFVYLFESLKTNLNLTSLNLARTKFQGIQYISQLIKEHPSITNLNLRGNNIGRFGILCIADAMKTNNTIRSLVLADNYISFGANYIFESLASNTILEHLNVDNNCINQFETRSLANLITNNSTIRNLSISGSDFGAVEGFYQVSDALSKNTTLRKITLDNCAIDDEMVVHLFKNIREVTCISLQNNKINFVGGLFVSNYVHDNPRMIVSIDKNILGSDESIKVSEGKLESIRLPAPCEDSHDVRKALRAFRPINILCNTIKLDKFYHSTDDELREYTSIISNHLIYNTTLEKLSLHDYRFKVDEFEIFTNAIIHNTTLRTLDLTGRRLNRFNEFVPLVIHLLSNNTTLNELNLKRNNLTEAEMIKLINFGFVKNTTLHSLCLANNCNEISYDFNHALSLVINDLPLKYLNISVNYFGGWGNLFHSLTFNTKLRFLNISYSTMTPEEVKQLGDLLVNNSCLTSLSMNDNNIGNDGFSILCESLEKNCSLEKLSICNNSISETATTTSRLTNLLLVNTTLQTLDLVESYWLSQRTFRSIEI